MICNVPRLSNAKTSFKRENTGPGKTSMLRLKEPVKLMQGVLQKKTKPGGLIFNPFVCSVTTAKACLLEKRHSKCFGCNMDSNCIERMKPSMLKMFGEQILNSESDIEEDEAVYSATCNILAIFKSSDSLKRKQACALDQNLLPAHMFPAHITPKQSRHFEDTHLFEKTRYLPFNQWSELWYSSLNKIDVTVC